MDGSIIEWKWNVEWVRCSIIIAHADTRAQHFIK